MSHESVHRVIEHHASVRGDLIALSERDRRVSYRELNYSANALARQLIARGFRRGEHAMVRMSRGIDLAIVLLAVLKAGGSYSWSDPDRSPSQAPCGVSFAVDTDGDEVRYLHLDVTAAVSDAVACSPNLPIVARGGDVACVLHEDADAPAVMVPHGTITALRAHAVTHPTPWKGEPGAFDLWIALMAGTTALVEESAAVVAA